MTKKKKKSKRPRIDEELFEALDEERENPNQGIDDVLMDEFPEIKEWVESKNEKNESTLF